VVLRLVLDWFATHTMPDHALRFPEGARWFAEAQLPTAFSTRHQGDQLAEKGTLVGGVIGHVETSIKGKRARLTLRPDAQHFVVVETKMFSPLSSGIKNARYFDQAARTVACMAETLKRANRYPVDMAHVGFYVLAPQIQIERGLFAEHLSRESIRQRVDQRIRAYDDKKKKRWYSEWVEPTIEQLAIDVLSWEVIMNQIREHDAAGSTFEAFYERCVAYNV
jgi:hypothetical protein